MKRKTANKKEKVCFKSNKQDLIEAGWSQADRAFHKKTQGIRGHRIGRIRSQCPDELREAATSSGLPKSLLSISLGRDTRAPERTFQEIIRSRKTCYQAKRDFTKEEFLAYLRDWLKSDTPRWNGIDSRKRRYPSGGGIYESCVFLLLQRIEGIPSGLYFFDVEERLLNLLVPIEKIPVAMLTFPFIATGHRIKLPPPQAQVLIAADIKRLSWAYTAIPYRVALSNATVLMSFGILWAEAHHLGGFPMGLYPANILAETLGVSELEYPLMSQFCLIGSLKTRKPYSSSRKGMRKSGKRSQRATKLPKSI